MGFALALVIVFTVWTNWALPKYFSQKYLSGEAEKIDVPPIQTERKFRGSSGSYSSNFSTDRTRVLATGPGKIVGRITAAQQPVKGLRIRLALNGSVMSQWSETDSDGLYSIAVPFGEYRVDGYEIDTQTANVVLANKIDNPNNPHSGGLFEAVFGKNGEGLSLDYVDPVIKRGPRGEVSLSKDIVVSWEPYPGATSYVIQVYESENIYDFLGRPIFRWPERPRVSESRVDLTELHAQLKPGHYYTVEIIAENAAGRSISQTVRQYNEKDFKAIGVQ